MWKKGHQVPCSLPAAMIHLQEVHNMVGHLMGGQLAHFLTWWPHLKETGGQLTVSFLAPSPVKQLDQMIHMVLPPLLTKGFASCA
jgi:hypothetical protein